MPLGGKWLGLTLVVLMLWLASLCRVWWRLLRQPRPGEQLRMRDRITLAGIGFSIVAVGSLLLLHLSWVSVSISQQFGESAIRVLSLFLFWATLAGFLFSVVGSGRKRFWGIGSCLITGLWWLSLATMAAISMGAQIARHPVRFLIPANYVGWVEVKYGETTAPILPMNKETLICHIPPDGVLVTSSLLEQGWANDEYFYYSQDGSTHELKETGWGKGGMIWGASNEWQQASSGSTPVQITAYFYVGTEERYHHAVSTNESRPFNESASQPVPNSRLTR
jgi:hypothetical protein